MKHTEICKIQDGADTAVLFIHGILGTPNHFSGFFEVLPESYSYAAVLLEGHGGDVADFGKASMDIWKEQIDKRIDELSKTHKSIIIVAHSMGCLLAIRQAYKNPHLIKKMILLAAPLKICVKPIMPLNALKVFFDCIKEDDEMALAAKRAYSLNKDFRVWRYFGWIARYKELFSEIKAVRPMLPVLVTPCYFFQSAKDEMVSIKSCELLNNSVFKLKVLEGSSHHYYNKSDLEAMLSKAKEILNQQI